MASMLRVVRKIAGRVSTAVKVRAFTTDFFSLCYSDNELNSMALPATNALSALLYLAKQAIQLLKFFLGCQLVGNVILKAEEIHETTLWIKQRTNRKLVVE